MPIEIESFAASDIGLVRQNNEDVFAHLKGQNFFILADGMGGHLAGEVAASETVVTLCNWIENFYALNPPTHADEMIAPVEKAIEEANQWVHALSIQDEEMAGMGTTLCLAMLIDKTLLYAHVGDSRIYRLRKGRISRLTVDHSLREELIASGKLDESSAASFPHKNVITRAIGTQTHVIPEIQTSDVQDGDLYFLCSDGLTDCLSDSEILRTIQSSDQVKTTIQKLIHAAKMKGAPDNITIVMFRVSF